MKRSLLLSLFAVAVVASYTTTASAQNVTLSLELFYRTNNTANNGTWQLYAKGDLEGLAGVATQISGIVGANNATFLAPAGFVQEITSGTGTPVAWNADGDGDAATLEMIFAQLPTAPASVVYNATNTTASPVFNRLLQTTVSPAGNPVNGADSLILAFGTFGAGSNPVLTASAGTNGSGANVYSTVGNATTVGTTVEATVTVQTRSNTGALGKRGDANLDGDVDVFQLNGGGDAQILGANLGCNTSSAIPCTWQRGDFNGDRDVDVFQLNGQGDAQILGGSLGSDAPAGTAVAIYDWMTGELTFDIGANVSIVGIETAGLFQVSGNSPALGAKAPDQFDSNVLAYFNFSPSLAAGVFAQGAVLPAKLDPSQIGFGYQSGGVDFVADVQVINMVPEPGTIAIALLAGVVGMGVRRRAA